MQTQSNNQIKTFITNTGRTDSYKVITSTELNVMLDDFMADKPTDCGFFIVEPKNAGENFIAVDNTYGHMFTEEFLQLENCVEYFKGEDIDEL